jgi:AraC-like DNA-binding protein
LLNYKDPAYFSRVFKGVTGKSPKEFRRGWVRIFSDLAFHLKLENQQ